MAGKCWCVQGYPLTFPHSPLYYITPLSLHTQGPPLLVSSYFLMALSAVSRSWPLGHLPLCVRRAVVEQIKHQPRSKGHRLFCRLLDSSSQVKSNQVLRDNQSIRADGPIRCSIAGHAGGLPHRFCPWGGEAWGGRGRGAESNHEPVMFVCH